MRNTFLALIVACALLAGCSASPQENTALALPEVTVGVVGAIQPTGTVDLLAGYISEQRELASDEAVMAFDTRLMELLRAQSSPSRSFRFYPTSMTASTQDASGNRLSALQYWVEFGKAHDVELLIVPQILMWHELEGSSVGAVSTAEVDVNFYLVDVKNATLLQRSHFAEKQQSLSSNLLTAGTFFKRGGKWLTTQELSEEAVAKMIKEFGL